jgi:ubiquinone/menaquinone biosynthesis C-methylase UbiE
MDTGSAKTYYAGNYAASYNRRWKDFSTKTLANTCAAIDFARLQALGVSREYPVRILDVGCGTGLLLQSLASRLPQAELYGVDESQDMLDQARLLLKDYPHMHFLQASLTGGSAAGLPYEPAFFDLITCTNIFHYFNDPVGVLHGLVTLLIPQGKLVIEDYARRTFPFPWRMFEWLIRHVDPRHVRAYTLSEASALCQHAGGQIVIAKKFAINFLWEGWVMQARVD